MRAKRITTGLFTLFVTVFIGMWAIAGPAGRANPGNGVATHDASATHANSDASATHANSADHAKSGDHANNGNQKDQNECNNKLDDDSDGLTDGADPGCQHPGCAPSQGSPKKCFEASDDTTPPPGDTADPCTAAAGDPGITGMGTIAQQAYDGGLKMVGSPLIEDPNADGTVTSQIYAGGNGQPVEPLTDEASCAGDLVIEPVGAAPLPDV